MFKKNEISPADIRHKEFKSSAFGYNKAEIRDYLDILAEYFEDLYSQRSMNKPEAPQIQVVYEEKPASQAAIAEIQKREELIAKALIQAEDTRDEIIKSAQKEAESIIREAELTAKKTIDETKHFLNLMKHEFLNLKENHKQFLLESHNQLKLQLNRLEQDDFFSKETESKVNEKFDEVSKIKVETNYKINEINTPKEEPKDKIIDLLKYKEESIKETVSINESKKVDNTHIRSDIEPVKEKIEIIEPIEIIDNDIQSTSFHIEDPINQNVADEYISPDNTDDGFIHPDNTDEEFISPSPAASLDPIDNEIIEEPFDIISEAESKPEKFSYTINGSDTTIIDSNNIFTKVTEMRTEKKVDTNQDDENDETDLQMEKRDDSSIFYFH